MKRCFIFAAGSFYGLRERPGDPGDFVIAAGYRACLEACVRPDLLIGDFDSMEPPADFARVRRLPVEKDDTDTLAAIRAGLEEGCTDFLIYGGTGGKRLDHTLANLQSLLFLRRRGCLGFLFGDDFLWTVIENGEIRVRKTVEWGLRPDAGFPPGRQQPYSGTGGPGLRPEGRLGGGLGAPTVRLNIE